MIPHNPPDIPPDDFMFLSNRTVICYLKPLVDERRAIKNNYEMLHTFAYTIWRDKSKCLFFENFT